MVYFSLNSRSFWVFYPMKTQDELIDAILTVSIGFYGSMCYIGCLNIVYSLIYHIGVSI